MFYNDILDTAKPPRQFKRAKVIALQKPGKDGYDAADYRLILLLSVNYNPRNNDIRTYITRY